MEVGGPTTGWPVRCDPSPYNTSEPMGAANRDHADLSDCSDERDLRLTCTATPTATAETESRHPVPYHTTEPERKPGRFTKHYPRSSSS